MDDRNVWRSRASALVEASLSRPRLNHSREVARLASELCDRFHADEEKGYIAGNGARPGARAGSRGDPPAGGDGRPARERLGAGQPAAPARPRRRRHPQQAHRVHRRRDAPGHPGPRHGPRVHGDHLQDRLRRGFPRADPGLRLPRVPPAHPRRSAWTR